MRLPPATGEENTAICMSDTNRIQMVELNCRDQSLYFPFCGQQVMQPDPEAANPGCHPCAHTLFIATDEGFEHRSARFDQLMRIEGVPDIALELGESGYDAFTDEVCCPGAVNYAVYTPAPRASVRITGLHRNEVPGSALVAGGVD